MLTFERVTGTWGHVDGGVAWPATVTLGRIRNFMRFNWIRKSMQFNWIRKFMQFNWIRKSMRFNWTP
eukprot:SAG31_NODE_572_length_13974_cov_28.935640_9_plen_67_part_00